MNPPPVAATITGSSLLDAPEMVPIRASETVARFGPTLIVAPHPDDESLGCGGALALLARWRQPVKVVFVTDGAASHPNSLEYAAPRLGDLRESEARQALASLGVGGDAAVFLRAPDGRLDELSAAESARVRQRCCSEVDAFQPHVVITPWRREAHPDHRAATALVRGVLRRVRSRARLLEYPVWAWEQGDHPRLGEFPAWRLDISAVVRAKAAAIASHRSQLTPLIADDPAGFRLTDETLAYFRRPWELYLETDA
ncbi:MAG: PIG-L family deacetylase [Chloroflexi bacterium]|nr:PIG-L family deacetylase [Chloroflexota bacterium]